MPDTRTTAEIFDVLYAHACRLWGEADAERQRPALQQTAEEIAIVAQAPIPPDLEPRLFT